LGGFMVALPPVPFIPGIWPSVSTTPVQPIPAPAARAQAAM
jgi:hypothetical protein